MGFYLTALEAGTEGITAEEVSDTIEQMKKPGVVRTYLEGLVPDLLAFLFQVVIACVVYAIGVKLIKLFRKLVRKWLDKKDADKGVKQFMDALVKCIGYFFLIVIILSLFWNCNHIGNGNCRFCRTDGRPGTAGKLIQLCRRRINTDVKTV